MLSNRRSTRKQVDIRTGMGPVIPHGNVKAWMTCYTNDLFIDLGVNSPSVQPWATRGAANKPTVIHISSDLGANNNILWT